jgi:glycosyltransferase involved in cell wall biosynthesis
MSKPLFSIVLIAKNEKNTLPTCLDSLKEFIDRGGEIVIGDTGSTDKTKEIALSYGCKVVDINAMIDVSPEVCDKINAKFVHEKDLNIMDSNGEKIFDFSFARNLATSYASNDFIVSLDCDEAYTIFDIDEVNRVISEGADQLEYTFVYAHNPDGSPSMQFKQSKAFNRRKLEWKGIIHEVLQKIDNADVKTVTMSEDIIKLEHWQEPGKETRGRYIIGLAYDCYNDLSNDRHSHYLARELMWTGRHRSAYMEFHRHIKMDKWPAEKAQSYIYLADCAQYLGEEEIVSYYYLEAFQIDSGRRESLIKLAQFYLSKFNYQAAICFAKAAQEIKLNDYYANHTAHYEDEPYRILYLSYGYLGRVQEAYNAIQMALYFKPDDTTYLNHLRYYTQLPTISVIIPHVKGTRAEGLEKCIESIGEQNYPQKLIDIIVVDGDDTVPVKVAKGVADTEGYYIVYAADDVEFSQNAFIKSVQARYALVAFNEGNILPDGGNQCTHFMIKRDFIERIGGEIFDTRFHHVGVDNLLWRKAVDLNAAYFHPTATIVHKHFSKGYAMDEVYEKGWSNVEQDRALLAEELQKLA